MRTIRFGRTNAQVPAISLGTWGHGGPGMGGGHPVGWSGNDDRLSKAALIEAHRRGITHWDTADAYGHGHAEKLIGEVFAEGSVPRKEIFLASKFGYRQVQVITGTTRCTCARNVRSRYALSRPTSSISTTSTTVISDRTMNTSSMRFL